MFLSVELKSFSRINLLTGINGAGKTTLLEAVFLNCGANNAALANRVNLFRDDFELSPFNDRLFKSFFFNFDTKQKVLIEVSGDLRKEYPRAKRFLQISPIQAAVGTIASTSEVNPLGGLAFTFSGPSGKSKGTITWEETEGIRVLDGMRTRGAGLKMSGKTSKDLLSVNFLTPYYRGVWNQTHGQLTEIVKAREVQSVVEQMKFVVPELRDLHPLSEDGVPVIYADIGKKNLIPATFLGAGFAIVLRIVLTAATLKNGAILIDEIEDGIHFSVFRHLIQIIFAVSKRNNIQFFVSTHSDEMLTAFAEVSREKKFKEISIYRLSRKNEDAYCTRFSHKEFLQATEIRAEIR